MKMMRTLRARLIAVFLLLGLSAMGILGFFALNRSSNAVIDMAWQTGACTSSVLAEKVEAYLRERAHVVEMQAERYMVQSMNWSDQEPALAPLYTKYDFKDIFVAEPDGTVHFVNRDITGVNIKDRGYFKKVMQSGKSVISDPIMNRATDSLVFVFASPIVKDRKVVGVLVASESLESLAEEVVSLSWGKQGYSYLVDTKGVLVAHPVKEILGKLNVTETGDKVSSELAQAMRDGLAGRSGRAEYHFNGKDQMNAYTPIPFTGWLAAVTAPREQFLVPVRALRNIIILVSLVLGLVIALVSFLFANSVAKPVKAISEVIDKQGELDFRFDPSKAWLFKCTGKEVQDMVQSVAKMQKAITETMRALGSAARTLGQDAEDFSAVAEETNASVEEAHAGAETVGTAMEGIAAIGEELNASVEEVAAGAGTVAARSSEVVEEVESARQAGEAGMEAISQTVENMKDRMAQVEESARATGELGEKAAQIQKIVATITGIADQTNLLALNAAIEAARAGEAGRGFAVVAEEVRKLAEESNNAAGDIANLAASIATDLTSVKEGAERSKEGARNMDTHISNVSEKITLIMRALEAIASSAQDVAAVGQEQAASSEEIASAVQDMANKVNDSNTTTENLRDQMTEVAAAAERVAQGGEDLTQISADLEKRIAAFKIDDEAGASGVLEAKNRG